MNKVSECERLQLRLADLEAAVKERDEEIIRLDTRNKSTYCAFCGQFFPADYDPEMKKTEAVQDHIKTCKQHPMRELEERIAALTAKFEEERKMCLWTQEQCDAAQDDYEQEVKKTATLTAERDDKQQEVESLTYELCEKERQITARSAEK